MSAAVEQRNQDATLYCGGLDERVSEELLWELMLQAGPVVNVHIPKDKVTGMHQSFGFVEFRTEEDADYAAKIMNMVRLFGKPIRVNKASQDRKNVDVGANLFIGNLAPEVDEKDLYDTFSAFGGITQPPKIMFDPDTGNSKGYGFVSFDNFEASDYAIECMNGAYLGGRPIVVQYAYKKDSKGERHGSQAERLLAAANAQSVRFKPHTMFATAPGQSQTLHHGPPPMAYPPPPPPQQHHMSGHYGMPPPPPQSAYAPPPPPPPPSYMNPPPPNMAYQHRPQQMQGMPPPPPPPPHGYPPQHSHHYQPGMPPPPPPPPQYQQPPPPPPPPARQ